MPRSRLTRQIFEWDYDRALNGRWSWCRDIKEILHKCGMVDRFERPGLGQWNLPQCCNLSWHIRTTTTIQGRPNDVKVTYLQCAVNVIGRNEPCGNAILTARSRIQNINCQTEDRHITSQHKNWPISTDSPRPEIMQIMWPKCHWRWN